MALEKERQRLERHEIGPGLIQLFNQIERPVVDRVPGHFGELHLPEDFNAVGLGSDQATDGLGRAPGSGSISATVRMVVPIPIARNSPRFRSVEAFNAKPQAP